MSPKRPSAEIPPASRLLNTSHTAGAPSCVPPPDEDPDAPIVLPADVTCSHPLDRRLITTRAGGLPVKGLEVKSAGTPRLRRISLRASGDPIPLPVIEVLV